VFKKILGGLSLLLTPGFSPVIDYHQSVSAALTALEKTKRVIKTAIAPPRLRTHRAKALC
jgi:hypothetical protein